MATPEFDIAQLTEDQQLALQQYIAVTDQNLDAAVPLLQRCGGIFKVALSADSSVTGSHAYPTKS